MANYGSLASELTERGNSVGADTKELTSFVSTLKGTFSGESATKLASNLTISIDEVEKQLVYIEKLANVLNLIETHKTNVKTLKDYKNKRDNWTSLDPLESNPYTSYVETWNEKVKNVEKQINESLPDITRITNSITLVKADIDLSYKDYAKAASETLKEIKSGLTVSTSATYQSLINAALDEWLQGFKNNKYDLKTSTLAKCGYTAEEVDSLIEERTENVTPREKAVISALTVLELGLNSKVKSQYKLSTEFFNSVSKPYNTEALINNGADCASYISWALDKSSSSGFNNATPKTIKNQGTKTSYKDLIAGDVLYNSSHVAMVIDNNTSDDYVVVADASHYETDGYPAGIRLQKIKYSVLKNNDFTGYDLTDFYAKSV